MTVDEKQEGFRIMGSRMEVSLQSYTQQILMNNPHIEVHVGCDSQNYGPHTVYVTAIVFRYPGNGAHVIYKKEKIPRIPDMWTKLWGETQRSVDLANFLKETCEIHVHQIDLDFNTDPSYPSNKLISASQGYISSLGYQSRAKPNLLMAAWAADALCH